MNIEYLAIMDAIMVTMTKIVPTCQYPYYHTI